jgi:hypothetical protein
MIALRLLHCNTKQGIIGGVQGNPVMKTGLSCNHYRVSLHAPCSTLFGIAVYMFQFLFAGYNVKVRHELLSGAIGTFEEENTGLPPCIMAVMGPSNDCYQELIWQTSSLDTRSSIGCCHIWSSSAVNGCHPCLWLHEMGPSMGRHTRHLGICCSFFLSL